MVPPPVTFKSFDDEDEKTSKNEPAYGVPYNKPYEVPQPQTQPHPYQQPQPQQLPQHYRDPMPDKETEITQYEKDSQTYEMKPHTPETKITSPTVAEPSYDPAREFLMLLFSPTTPFAKRRQLMMEY